MLGPSLITPHTLPSPTSSTDRAADSEGGPAPQVKLPARLGLMAELLHHLSNLSSASAAASATSPSQGGGAVDAGAEELMKLGMPQEVVLQVREGCCDVK